MEIRLDVSAIILGLAYLETPSTYRELTHPLSEKKRVYFFLFFDYLIIIET